LKDADSKQDICANADINVCKLHCQIHTCMLSSASQQEAAQSRCTGNATLPGKVHQTRLAVSSVDCDQLLSCTASSNRQTVYHTCIQSK